MVFQLVDKVIDKLVQAVEKDADFVIRGSLAYKSTVETRRAKSLRTPDNSGVLFCRYYKTKETCFNMYFIILFSLLYSFCVLRLFRQSEKPPDGGFFS